MRDKLKEFFDQPGINKSGVCNEAKVSQQYLNRVLKGTQPLTDNMVVKMRPVLRKYGCEI